MNPWIEKYRPKNMDEIIINDYYKKLFDNIVNHLFIPPLIFYGPPGTGKTTTILCLINLIKKKYNMTNNIIHLNASDDRGIEIVRNIIHSFIFTKGMYTNTEIKFIILDEVDSMTKNAQYSLIHIINNMNKNIKIFLICNYISKIIPELRNKFLILNYYYLDNYKHYLQSIINHENVNITSKKLDNLISNNKPDIRSIVNSLQLYKYTNKTGLKKETIHYLCKHYNLQKLKKLLMIYDNTKIIIILFNHIINEYKIDDTLIHYMKNMIYRFDIYYFDKILIPYFFKIQN